MQGTDLHEDVLVLLGDDYSGDDRDRALLLVLEPSLTR